MGMGRHIFRKQAVVRILSTFVLLSISAHGLYANSSLENRTAHSTLPVQRSNPDFHLDHMEAKIWSIDLPRYPQIDHYLDYFSREEGVAYLQRSLKRAELFLPFIMDMIDEKDLPRELIYLPLIESAYRVDALSRSGAAGLWQFMMNSIDPYDITVNAWQDDRRDFWKSTDAALDKLFYNYEETGDWLLALAGYNCGLNKVKRTIKSTEIRDYWELIDQNLLPRETRNYIPKLAAVSILCESKGALNIPLYWPENDEWDRIALNKSVDIRKIAQKAGLDEEQMSIWHNELHYAVTPPASSGYKLKVPARLKDTIETILREEEDLLEFKRYAIQSGDTLSELAQWYRIPLRMIEDYNPGVSSRYLRVGQVLLIPLLHADIKDKEGIVSPEMTEEWKGRYTVQEGDSLWGISRSYETSPELLASANKIPMNAVIKPGMVLNVPRESSDGELQ